MSLRPATAEDAAAVLRLYDAYDPLEFGAQELELIDVVAALDHRDSQPVVALEDDAVIGYAHLAPNGECETVVDPSYAGAGRLQAELLGHVLSRARERGVENLEHWAGAEPERAGHLLAAAGFHHARSSWTMERALVSGDVEKPVWPSGTWLREYDRDRDARTVWALVQEAFRDGYGSHPRPFGEWARLTLDCGFEPLVVLAGTDVVAVSTRAVRQGAGFVGQLGVDRRQRGRGLAVALLREGFRRDRAAGLTRTLLEVDGDNAGAQALYVRAGMVVIRESRRWERAVRASV